MSNVIFEEGDSRISYHPDFVDATSAADLLGWMLTEAPWQTETPVIFGVPRTVKRKTCAFGNPGVTYRYSGMTKTAMPWPSVMQKVHQRASLAAGVAFNFCLANLYPDGDAGIGAHADDEADIIVGSPIIGISLGSTRDFVVTRKTGERVLSQALEHNSAIIMRGAVQENFKHAVPPRKRVKTSRVSLTFRSMR